MVDGAAAAKPLIFGLVTGPSRCILAQMSKSTVSIVLVTLICWTALVAGADYFVFGTTLRQCLAQYFAAARCQIVSSEVTPHAIFHYGVSVEYSYIVNGKEYRSEEHTSELQSLR